MKKLGIILLLIIQLAGFGQNQDLNEAKEFFRTQNYSSAIISYRLFLIDNPENKTALKQIGLSYLLSDLDRSKSIKYFKKCIALGKYDKEILYYLTQAYLYDLDYKNARETIEKYQIKPGKFKKEIPRLINQINYSELLVANPKDVRVENLGDKVNTNFPEYYPFIDKKERTLVFTTKRPKNKGTIGNDGSYMSDIYTNTFSGFNFTRSKNCKSLNGNFNDECVGIKDDGSYIYMSFNTNSSKQPTDVFKSKKRGSTYKKKIVLRQGFNTTKYFENAGCFNKEENTIYFSSNQPGGSGGYDIYMMKKLPDGSWGKPENIKEINTYLNEEFPYYNSYDSTLYFSSDGLPGMGEFDLFKTKWNSINKSWSEPANLGYPINSAYSEKTICFGRENKHAYISSIRKGGLGGYDLYRINYEKITIRPVLYLITVKEDSTQIKLDSASIEILNLDNKIFGKYKANPSNGIFSVIIEPGNYKIRISSNDHTPLVRKFNVSSFAYDKRTIRLNYLLKKKDHEH